MAYMRLGDLLLSSGMISHEQLERALELQKESKERLGDVLVQSGIITEQQLIEALKIQLGVEFVDLTAVSIPVELAKYVPRTLAKKYCVVPVKLVRDTLYLAMSDPLDFIAQEEVKAASRKRVIPMIATHRATEQAISRLYGSEGTARVIEEMKREAGSAGPDIVPAQLAKDSDSSEGAPTIRFVNSLIERAFTERASDIHLEPQEGEMVVRMRIDGLLRRVLTVPAELQSTVISRLKIMGGMDIAERKVPQDGHAMLRVKGSEIDLRISSMPTVYGEKIVLRLLNKTSQLLSRDAIGLEGEDLEYYQTLLRNTGGVILLVGPTGSGKSTTMCVMLRDLAREEVNIVTLEDPVEYYIPGVSQCQINEKTGMTFAGGLRAILPGPRHHLRRRDPRRRDREHRHARGHHRPSGALDPAHQRRPLRGRPSARRRRGAVADLRRAARRGVAAACAPHLPALQKSLSSRERRAGPAGAGRRAGPCVLQGRGLPGLSSHRLHRPPCRVRDPDDRRAAAPPHHRRRERGRACRRGPQAWLHHHGR